jgi:hypothetical protein
MDDRHLRAEMIMAGVALVAALIGVVVGIRFQYLFLVLVVAFTLAAIAGFAIVHGRGVEWAIFKMVLAAAALQVGYLCGAVVRFVIAEVRSVIAAARE